MFWEFVEMLFAVAVGYLLRWISEHARREHEAMLRALQLERQQDNERIARIDWNLKKAAWHARMPREKIKQSKKKDPW